jgi:hypothetical protein
LGVEDHVMGVASPGTSGQVPRPAFIDNHIPASIE